MPQPVVVPKLTPPPSRGSSVGLPADIHFRLLFVQLSTAVLERCVHPAASLGAVALQHGLHLHPCATFALGSLGGLREEMLDAREQPVLFRIQGEVPAVAKHREYRDGMRLNAATACSTRTKS